MSEGRRILVLGVGNLLWADEGFGVRVVERLAAGWRFPDSVQVVDGGTQGLYLLPLVEEADVLILADAVDFGLEPGSRCLRRDDEVPAYLGAKKMSLHQTGFQEVLASAALLGRLPERLVLVGVQPETLDDYGGGLTAAVAAQVDWAVATVHDLLEREFGVVADPLPAAVMEGAVLAAPVARALYEGGRPTAEDACRIGDPRVLFGGGA